MRVESIPVSSIVVPTNRARQRQGIASLTESIKNEGLLHPILVNDTKDGSFTLVSGLHRIEAFRQLGITEVPAHIKDMDELEARLAEISENLQRSELSKLERARHISEQDEIYQALGLKKRAGRPRKPLASESGEGNQLEAESKSEGRDGAEDEATKNQPTFGRFSEAPVSRPGTDTRKEASTDTADSSSDSKADTLRDEPEDNISPIIGNQEFARQMGMSEAGAKEYRRIARSIAPPLQRTVLEMPLIADNLKELKALSRLPVREQIGVVAAIKVGEAKNIRDARRSLERGRTRLMSEEVEPVGELGTFHTIVLDPPWDGKDTGDDNPFGKIEPVYSTMTYEEIRSLPVGELAEDDDCHLYLWVTGRTLPMAFKLIESWGFRYIQPMVWVKHRQGTGRYYANQAEFVLFAMKGNRLLGKAGVPNVFYGRRREHSRKPEEFYDIVRQCSPGPRLDMFQREAREGFVGWGAEAEAELFVRSNSERTEAL